MEGVNGFQVAERLKHNPAVAKVPIITLTGHPVAEENRAWLRRCGMETFIWKAGGMQALVGTINRLLDNETATVTSVAEDSWKSLFVKRTLPENCK